MSKEKLKRKSLERHVILKVMTDFVKHLKKKLSLLRNEMKLLEKMNDELMRRYGGQETVVGRSARRLLKIFATRFPPVTICINRAIRN